MQNDLRVVAGEETVSFLVNGVEAARVPRPTVAPKGLAAGRGWLSWESGSGGDPWAWNG